MDPVNTEKLKSEREQTMEGIQKEMGEAESWESGQLLVSEQGDPSPETGEMEERMEGGDKFRGVSKWRE